jgi:hypothetical protein
VILICEHCCGEITEEVHLADVLAGIGVNRGKDIRRWHYTNEECRLAAHDMRLGLVRIDEEDEVDLRDPDL